MKNVTCFILALLAFTGIASSAAPDKPASQYKSEGIEVPAASADEPKVKSFGPETVKAAAKYLDDGEVRNGFAKCVVTSKMAAGNITSSGRRN